jgi:hypothetical protein
MKTTINKIAIIFAAVVLFTSCAKESLAQPCATCPNQQPQYMVPSSTSFYAKVISAVPDSPQSDQGIPTYTALQNSVNITTGGSPADLFYGKPIDYLYWTLKVEKYNVAMNAMGQVVATRTLQMFDVVVLRDNRFMLVEPGAVLIVQDYGRIIAASGKISFNGAWYLDPNSTMKTSMMITGKL